MIGKNGVYDFDASKLILSVKGTSLTGAKLYDRLLVYVLNSPGLYALQEYEKVLKKEYPEQILNKYKDEVSKMAVHTSDRKNYAHLVSLLRKMQQMKGGSKLVEQIVAEWKIKYKNRPAMMDELRKL